MAAHSAPRDATSTSSLITNSVPGEETTIPAPFHTDQPATNAAPNRRQRRMAGKQQQLPPARIPAAGRNGVAVNPRQFAVRRRGGR
ncbi:hypothetical protein [Goodfellowiella coeruleoviolacea]|uniref:Uncharacterized protein n=1 Tax=Goodfellowiella coeruleoviolacea TaxID=334858 RepID=A0AAE3GA08_9PSEU|nr:hypothetical protein [Goodfellowiella coeruleoviolacea]MCP2163998.1 hypothetical protein [Goodfellowiella coeruleoviolacea]